MNRQVDFRRMPMRDIDMIVVHCSGSRCDHRYTMKMLRYDHVHIFGIFFLFCWSFQIILLLLYGIN